MNKMVLLVLAVVGISLIKAIGDPQPALAATSEIGKRVGNEIKSWATMLLLGVAALVAIPVLAKRDVNGGVVLALLVLLVGGFAFAPESVKKAIESMWRSVAG
jgi:cobalamin synthase